MCLHLVTHHYILLYFSINFKASPGELVAVVGQVGAGKSSLISALLGEMNKVEGAVSLRVRHWSTVPAVSPLYHPLGYCGVHTSASMDTECHGGMLYDHTIDACALRPDLSILPGNDMTEIGEKVIPSTTPCITYPSPGH